MNRRKHWESIDKRRRAWESRMIRALKRYFNAEKKAILKALETNEDWRLALVLGVNMHSAQLEKILTRYYKGVFRDFARDTYRNISVSESFEAFLSGIDEALVPYMADIGKRVVGINEVTINRIQSAIESAIEQRATITEVQESLYSTLRGAINKSVKEMNAARTRTIARTEVGKLSVAGQVQSIIQSGAEGIEWIATFDANTRDSHAALDGEKIRIGEKFSNGLRWPLDPNGSAGEIINCRCAAGAVFFDD